MDKGDFLGTAQVAGGTYIGYQGLKHGLPRALGVRIEYHTTSNRNAKLIKDTGNVLDPRLGGRNGWGQKITSNRCINNSRNYVHITGFHKDSKLFTYPRFKKLKVFEPFVRTIGRKTQSFMYQIVGNGNFDKVVRVRRSSDSFFKKAKILLREFINVKLNNKTKCFCIPGIDSYFNKEFITDLDDPLALKSSKPLKVYNNRFSAMIGGFKKFGLKGIKENKCRALTGAGLLITSGIAGYKLINKGIKNISV